MMERCGIDEPKARLGLAADGLLHTAGALIGQLLGKLEPRARKWDTVAHGPEIRPMLICRCPVSHPQRNISSPSNRGNVPVCRRVHRCPMLRLNVRAF